jgi:hypothetical protein
VPSHEGHDCCVVTLNVVKQSANELQVAPMTNQTSPARPVWLLTSVHAPPMSLRRPGINNWNLQIGEVPHVTRRERGVPGESNPRDLCITHVCRTPRPLSLGRE